MKKYSITLLLSAALLPLYAAEYFTSLQGSDVNDGLSRTTAFGTIQQGVDALVAGDTLTILPGEYFENVQRTSLGTNTVDSRIRAAIPGTVLLRGDVPAPVFTKVEGYRFVYVAEFAQPVMAVNEVDTLMTMGKSANIDGVEFQSGTFHYDADQKKLFISTTDLQAPDQHYYTIAINQNHGLYLEDPCRVIVEGLAFTGFNTDKAFGWGADSTKSGLLMTQPVQCVVRECTAYLNSAGLMLSNEGVGISNVIEHCVSYGNYSALNGEGCNIQVLGPNLDTIRDCYGYLGRDHNISMYGRVKDPKQTFWIKNCVAWGAWLDIQQKTGAYGVTENSVAFNCLRSNYMKNCLYGVWGYPSDPGPDSVKLPGKMADWDTEFADPDNLDFRLQSNSRLRGQGTNGTDLGVFQYQPTIFYVASNGNDTADGLSVKTAWKTIAFEKLKAGDTLYLEPGNYSISPLTGASNITIRGRGVNPASITGPFVLQRCAGITLERLYFPEALKMADSRGVRIRNCTLAGIQAQNVDGLRLEHGVLTGKMELQKCKQVFSSGNVYTANVNVEGSELLYSDYNNYSDLANLKNMPDNYSQVLQAKIMQVDGVPFVQNRYKFGGRGPLGTALGLYHEFRKKEFPLAGPFVHSASATTANLEWWTSQPALTEVAWGDTPECENTQQLSTDGYNTFSLTGLQPNQKLYFKIKSMTAKPDTSFAQIMEGMAGDSQAVEVKTAVALAKPRTFYVALDGRAENTGLSREQAWPTIGQAADHVNAGDTVLIAGGKYREIVQMRTTGDKDRPITFKSLPGEKVVLDGNNRSLDRAISIQGKSHLIFDGLYFTGHGYGSAIVMSDCSNIQVRRCFFRQEGAVRAKHCSDLLIQNCVIGGAMEGVNLNGCSNTRYENNVSFVHLIMHGQMIGGTIYCSNNIFTDNQVYKLRVPMFILNRTETLIETNNCYFLRIPDAERNMFHFYGYVKPPQRYGLFSLADYYKETDRNGRSLFCDPQFKALVGVKIPPYKGVAEKLWTGLNVSSNVLEAVADGKPGFAPDSMMQNADFDAFFATNPEVVQRGIGLQPEAFADFNFDQPELTKSPQSGK